MLVLSGNFNAIIMGLGGGFNYRLLVGVIKGRGVNWDILMDWYFLKQYLEISWI